MLRKSKALILCMILCIGLLIPFESMAYGESPAMDFYVKYSEPTTSEYGGYISVAYSNNGTYRMYTYFWIFTPVGDNNYAINSGNHMFLTINSDKLTFQPFCSSVGCDVVLCCYDWQDNLHVLNVSYLPAGTQTFEIYSDNYSATPIHGYCVGGNAHISQYSQLNYVSVPTIHWNESVDASQLDEQMARIMSSLNNIDSDTSTMISQLENIYNQNVATNQKLEDLKYFTNLIKQEQEESNTWLEKIFNWLKDSPEQEKQEAQTQGNQSTSDATTAITDNSQGFIDSLGGLANSMSYSGTNCSWTFPAITLPAIPGVMPGYQLTSEKPIDFSYWVNQIPANLLLLIQSLLTLALIIYCFKEVYGTISYVLTLRGGGSE